MITKNIHPYEIVSKDKTREQENDRFRIIIYGAYNAFGLIGPENNGIAILDNKENAIVCDQIAKIDSGYFGPSKSQIKTFDNIMNMGKIEFRIFVNEHYHTRYII